MYGQTYGYSGAYGVTRTTCLEYAKNVPWWTLVKTPCGSQISKAEAGKLNPNDLSNPYSSASRQRAAEGGGRASNLISTGQDLFNQFRKQPAAEEEPAFDSGSTPSKPLWKNPLVWLGALGVLVVAGAGAATLR